MNLSSPFFKTAHPMRADAMYCVCYLARTDLVFPIDEYLRRERSTYSYSLMLENAITECHNSLQRTKR